MLLQSLRNTLRHMSARAPRCSFARQRIAPFRGTFQARTGGIETLEDRTLLAQVVVLNQVADFPGDFNFWASSVNSAVTEGNIVYEGFLFEETTEFNNVAWQGLYLDSDPGANPVDPNTATWRVNIWNDNGFGTGPGTDLLLTQDVAAANVASQFVANASVEGGLEVPVFNFGTDLATTFEATADVAFWASVVSIAAGDNDPTWNWMSGTGGDGVSAQQVLGGADTVARAGDRAMRFINNTDNGNNGPAAPSTVGPTGTISETQPTFTWTAVAEADQYDIWVNVAGSNELVFRNQNVTGTSFTSTTELAVDQSYVWTVRAIDGGVAGDWAAHATFTVTSDADLAAPTIIAPTGTINTTQPTYEWTAVAGADHFDVWVNVFGTNELVIRDQNVAGTSFTPSTALEIDQRYVWTVRAVDSAGGAGAWAAHATFQVDVPAAPPSDPPTLLRPVDVTNTPAPRFEWEAVSGATHYDVWVNVFGSNQLVFRDRNVATTELDSPVTLTDGQRYIWTVRAFFNDAAGEWADHATFTVDVLVVTNGLDVDDLAREFGTRFDTGEENPRAESKSDKAAEHAPVEPASNIVANRQPSPVSNARNAGTEGSAAGIDEAMSLWNTTEWWADRTAGTA